MTKQRLVLLAVLIVPAALAARSWILSAVPSRNAMERCLMNGSNHLDEADDRPLHLCPVCLRKLHDAVAFAIPARYEQLRSFCERAEFEDEAAWFRRRLAYLEGQD
jgi:hypothetical protein